MVASETASTSRTASPRGIWRDIHSMSGDTSAATATEVNTHATTRSASRAISRTSTVSASATTIANAERSEMRTASEPRGAREVRASSAIDSYDTDVVDADLGPSEGGASVDIDPRSALPLSIAVAMLAVAV